MDSKFSSPTQPAESGLLEQFRIALSESLLILEPATLVFPNEREKQWLERVAGKQEAGIMIREANLKRLSNSRENKKS